MQAIGIDLAWGEVNEAGLVAIGGDGRYSRGLGEGA
jgi:hypothetical protein